MSVTYSTITREVLKHFNGIAGTSATSMATNYAVSPLTTTEADDPVYSLAYIQDVMADIQGRLANEIASVVNPLTGTGVHPWRSFFASFTNALSNAGDLPVEDTLGVPIIGAWGSAIITAGGSEYPGTPTSIERLRASQQNPDGIYTLPLYEYCIYGQKIYFANTSNTGVLEVCVYDRADALLNIQAGDSGMLLPDALADAYVAGCVSAIIVESEYLDQASAYSAYFSSIVNMIRGGATAMPGLMVPMGAATAAA